MRNATLPADVNPKTPARRQLPPVDTGKPIRHLRWTLIGLVLLLVSEGLFRKLEPNRIGVLIFLLKDLVVCFMALQLAFRHRLPPAINFLYLSYLTAIFFFLPCIVVTASHDPLLAIFGTKQYLLYPVVALVVFVVFENARLEDVVGFCRLVAVLMIPCGLVAMLETALPASHWLNMSVDGESLEAFSSAGHLRVSSTFSFVSQFCSFLNMEMFMIFLALHGWKYLRLSRKWLYLLPIPFVVVCSYLTGSRGAVVGNTALVVIAMGLSFMRFEVGKTLRLMWIGLGIVGVIVVFQYFFPGLMATYSVREQGRVLGVSPEIQQRIYDAFFGWMSNTGSVPFFGNGLGIMSNGSDAISSYARGFRSAGWTETDLATTLFEGGPYLIFVWYGFRYFIIAQTTWRFLFQVDKSLALPAAFCQAFVILVGFTGTLGIQPPEAIWWWLGVGLSTTLWWRSLHPIVNPTGPAAPVHIAPPTIRGRSSYAEQLHERK